MEYRKIIEQQKAKLHKSIQWWPNYFYHFTDIHNAIGIIDKEWIYDRSTALEKSLMLSDNASESVINATVEQSKHYGRLYFRPLTPTQYHNEGYKPPFARNRNVNASCPIPVFFCLDAEKTLHTEGIQFVECGLAGNMHREMMSGEDAYGRLHFDKIYHNGAHEVGSDITQFRHSEIIREGGIPVDELISYIVCRTLAEKQTLLYMLQHQLPYKYKKYYKRIIYNPQLNMFFNNGIFIQAVYALRNGLRIDLNDANMRIGRENALGNDIKVEINIYWTDVLDKRILKKESHWCMLDYAKTTVINVPLQNRYSDLILVEVKFDDITMFNNYINLRTEELV